MPAAQCRYNQRLDQRTLTKCRLRGVKEMVLIVRSIVRRVQAVVQRGLWNVGTCAGDFRHPHHFNV